MGEKTNDQSVMDKSMRSVFVGNIPYEATEEKLKEIFSEVGPVISLKLVFDRESGKPKGYGFCEYKDQETALSAMRNLNGYEIGGRTLRVDNACTEKSRMEMQQLLQGPQVENPYGEHCDAENAPEIITKTVASLPPEQMYELMKQMKLCIQNNPNEARQMLLVNPQLAYALLQAQVVMRIVDPQQALSMLYKANTIPPVLNTNPVTGQPQQLAPQLSPMAMPPQSQISNPGNVSMPPMMNSNYGGPMGGHDVDLRNAVDPRMSRNLDLDMRGGISNPVPNPMDQNFQRNPRQMLPPQPVMPPFQSGGNVGGPPIGVNMGGPSMSAVSDPRQRGGDPRLRPTGSSQPQPGPSMPSIAPPTAVSQARLTAANGIPNDASDQEKAALIMQVLQLSDEQIAMLPPEQRASILVLKEQIAKSTQR